MFDSKENNPVKSWLPSEYQPSPRRLGDFLKLISYQVPEPSNGNSRYIHLTTVVNTLEFCYNPSPSLVLETLELSIDLFQQQ